MRLSPIFMMMFVCLVLGAQWAGAGAMYRWKDASGKLHFTDTPPPPGAQTVEMKENTLSVVKTVPSPNIAPASPAAPPIPPLGVNVRQSAPSAPPDPQTAKDLRCEQMREQLKRMDDSTRVRIHSTMQLEEAYADAGCRR